MSKLLSIAGNVIGWILFLGFVYMSYRFLWKGSMPNLFYKGWKNLQADYGLTEPNLPAGVVMHPTTLRVGSERYAQTAHLGLDETSVYLQRPLAGAEGRFLRIPYTRLKLMSPPGRSGILNAPVYGIFSVNGVDVWIDSPYAEQIIQHLSAP